MSTKAEIFNLALGALLLNKRISDTTTDTSVENQTLNIHYNTALVTTLQDLDLDSTASQVTLELLGLNPNALWSFAYKYPTNCAFLRRIQSTVLKDTRSTQISKRTGLHNGMKAIFTNEENAIAEYVPKDFSLTFLGESASLAVAYKLAILSAPLISGKGASALRKEILASYVITKAQAQEFDRLENSNFDEDDVISEFVETRIS